MLRGCLNVATIMKNTLSLYIVFIVNKFSKAKELSVIYDVAELKSF